MSYYKIKRSCLQGEVVIPPSKSHSLRAILFASLAKGRSKIRHYLPSPDIFQMIEACRLFGAHIDVKPDVLTIEGVNGKIVCTEDVIDAGNSGIVLRFCSAIGALANHPVVVTGDASIRHQRPMEDLLQALRQLQVSARSMRGDGFAPVIIEGPVKPGQVVVSGEDSQPVSALIIAGAFAAGPIEISVKNPGEKPWIEMTLYWLDKLKIPYERKGFHWYKLDGNTQYEGFDYTVPGDHSSAAFPIAAALVTGSEVKIKNIDMEDPQGDKKLIEVFQQMGAPIHIDKESASLVVKKSKSLQGVQVDINDFVDAITILSVVACFAEGETLIYNGAVAKQKECNRIHSIAKELKKMGAKIEETEDGLKIQGSALTGSKLYSHHDHRMVMSLSVAALGAEGSSIIEQVECVSKTFPTFATDLTALGAHIEEGAR